MRLFARTSAGAVALLLACAMASGSCGRDARGASEDPVLRIGFGVGTSARDTSLAALTDLLYAETLLTRGVDGRTTGRLAEAWQWEDGGRRLRLRLRNAVQMHDRTAFTAPVAAQVLAGFVAKDGRKAPWGFEHVTSVTAPDERTILLTLSEPDIFLLSGLADRRMIRSDAPDVGTGPFRLVRRDPVVETERFTPYHGGPSGLAGVRIVTYDTPRSVWAGLMRAEIDAAQEVSRDAVEFMEQSSKITIYPTVQPFYVSMVFNHGHQALGRVEVRRALSEAVDKATIIERAMRGRGRQAETAVWPFHWAYADPPDRYTYRPDSAQLRLDKAGFKLPRASTAGEVRSRFKFTCMVYNEDPQYERIALMVQRQLFDIGVDMQIELVSMSAFAPRAASGRFDAFLMKTNAGRSLDITYRFWRSVPSGERALQKSGYTGADGPLDSLRQSTSDEEVRTAIIRLTQKFHEDAPAVFIAWLEVTRAVDSRFNVGEKNGEDPFANIWQWRAGTAFPGQ